MSKTLKAKPEIRLMLEEEVIRAIGHVIAQWAYAEREIHMEMRWLRKRYRNRKESVNYRARFSTRVSTWVRMAKRTYRRAEEVVAVHRISGRIIALKDERDDVAHGTFTGGGGFFKFREGRMIDFSDNFGRADVLEDLACRISEVNATYSNINSHSTDGTANALESEQWPPPLLLPSTKGAAFVSSFRKSPGSAQNLTPAEAQSVAQAITQLSTADLGDFPQISDQERREAKVRAALDSFGFELEGLHGDLHSHRSESSGGPSVSDSACSLPKP